MADFKDHTNPWMKQFCPRKKTDKTGKAGEFCSDDATGDYFTISKNDLQRKRKITFLEWNYGGKIANASDDKKSQDYVKIGGFYRPSRTRPILTQGIQICSQKWSQVNISIGYGYISQVKILYKVKFSKLEICQSDCRFKILGKNY